MSKREFSIGDYVVWKGQKAHIIHFNAFIGEYVIEYHFQHNGHERVSHTSVSGDELVLQESVK